MYNVKEFNELETMALKEGLYIDPQLMTATPTFAAATCTVSNKEGKRIFRAVSGKSVAEVTEQAITLALCAYYGKPVPAPFAVENVSIPAEPPVKTPSVSSGKQSESAAKAGTTQRSQNDAKGTAAAAVGNRSEQNKEEEKAIQTPPVGEPAADAKNDRKTTAKNTAAADTKPAAADGAATKGGADDFQVLVGKYRTRDDNYISQMLETEDGRNFLTKIINIASPSPQIKPYLDKTKAYLDSHGIQL